MMNQGAKKAGYVSQPAATDPRSTEAWALSEASRRLVVGAKTEDGGKSLRDALILNQRLWTIFQTAMAEPDCPLPREIRDNVLALSIMMDRQILQRLGDLDGSKLQPILDINRCVAEGLAQKPQVAEAGMAQPMQANDANPIPAVPAVGGARMAVNVSA
ncbi:flagellar biosynthesis regulator FlaF [Dongia sp. agr-C8]